MRVIMIDQHELRDVSTRLSETMRYLRAAAYLDKSFADEVILRVLPEEHRTVASCMGLLCSSHLPLPDSATRQLLRGFVLTGLAVPLIVASDDRANEISGDQFDSSIAAQVRGICPTRWGLSTPLQPLPQLGSCRSWRKPVTCPRDRKNPGCPRTKGAING